MDERFDHSSQDARDIRRQVLGMGSETRRSETESTTEVVFKGSVHPKETSRLSVHGVLRRMLGREP
jgi:hypothetical protein